MGVILFDIDGTLFDNRKFGDLYRGELSKTLGVSAEDLYSIIADYYSTLEMSTDFEPDGLISFLANRFNIEQQVIADIFWEPSYYKESMFEEVKGSLKRLSGENSLGVFSQGLRSFQEYKLEQMDLLSYIDPSLVLIYKRRVAEEAFASIPRGALMIEDKHDIAVSLSKITKTIWINRLSNEKDPSIATIHTLDEINLE